MLKGTGRHAWARLALATLGLAGLTLAWGCTPDSGDPDTWDPLMSFDTIDAAIVSGGDTISLTAELANTSGRRSYGLMDRSELPARHGMIFVYPETQTPAGGFYMYRTRIPLDIAFLAADGEILSILAMEPCPSPNPDVCRRYSPGMPYRGALEVARGFFERHGVGVGDRVVPGPAELSAES